MVQHLFEEIIDEEITELGEIATLYELCHFTNCDFTGIDLSRVTFVDCDFTRCNFSAVKVAGTIMNNCRFRESKLVGIHFSDMAQETLELAFDQCRIDSCSFDNLVLMKLKFGGSDLIRTEFSWSDFSGGDFSGCDLKESRFINCNLEKCDFRNAAHLDIDLRENRVTGAKFSMAAAVELLYPFGVELE